MTAAGIFRFLAGRGHELVPASSLRCRWIFWKPWLWLRLLMERRQAVRRFTAQPCDITEDMWGAAQVYDADGDASEANPLSDPYFTIFPEWEFFDGLDWPQGAMVNISVAGKPVCEALESWASPKRVEPNTPSSAIMKSIHRVFMVFLHIIIRHAVRI